MASATFTLSDTTELCVKKADITREHVGAIVNASNPELSDRGGGGGGGGVNAAVHRAAGPELLEHCQAVPQVQPNVRCPTGEAIVMPAFRLPAQHLIMTSGPAYDNDVESAPLLRAAFRNSIKAAAQAGCSSVAMPLISAGDYGYPPDKAADEAIRGMRDALANGNDGGGEVVRAVRICTTDNAAMDAMVKAARRAGLAEGDSGE